MKQLVIIGGGISGLFLANKYQNDYNVILLERDNDIGGKIQTYDNCAISTQTTNSPTKCEHFKYPFDTIICVIKLGYHYYNH